MSPKRKKGASEDDAAPPARCRRPRTAAQRPRCPPGKQSGAKATTKALRAQRRILAADQCLVCKDPLTEEYQGSLPEPSALCEDHRAVHRGAFPIMSEAEAAESYHNDQEFAESFDRCGAVNSGDACAAGEPADVARVQEFVVQTERAFGAYTRSEFRSRFGYLPEQLGVRPWSLHDEWGADAKLVLTSSTERAPRVIRMISKRSACSSHFVIDRHAHLDGKAGDATYNFVSEELQSEMRDMGSRILEVEDIEARSVRKKESGDAPDSEDATSTTASAPASALARGAICKPPASKVTPPPPRTSRLDGDVKLRKLDKLTSVNLCRLNTLGSVVTESTMSSPRPSRDPAASCPAASEDEGATRRSNALSERGDESAKKPLATEMGSAADGTTLEDFEEKYPDDPLKAKWAWQASKMDLSVALAGRKLGRQRDTASGYADQADKANRGDEGDKLREKMRLCEAAEKLGQGAWFSMPRAEMDTLLTELKFLKVEFPTKAKIKLLERVRDLTFSGSHGGMCLAIAWALSCAMVSFRRVAFVSKSIPPSQSIVRTQEALPSCFLISCKCESMFAT